MKEYQEKSHALKIIELLESIEAGKGSVTTEYEISNTDQASTATQYFGFLNATSAWYILKLTDDSAGNQAFTYTVGASNYSTNWTNRAALTYSTFDQAF